MIAPALAAAVVTTALACGKPRPPVAAPTKSQKPADPAAGGAPLVTPSRLLPELVGPRGLVAAEEGHRRFLVDRMRVLARSDGSIARGAELLPGGTISSVALPSRLGGGYLFHVNAGGGTEIWRASSWLGKLRPLTRRGEVVSEIVPGFDRLYARLSSGNRVIALDPETGEQVPLGSLPVAGTYGQLAFADGWRAVVDVDLRGPLATFDGGNTWRPLGITEKPQGVGIFDGDPGVIVAGSRYVVSARGVVTQRPDAREKRAPIEAAEARDRGGPLGKRPLRAAVEDGFPDGKGSALVARGGALARVSLRDGSIEAIHEDAYPDARAGCHAVRLGPSGVGFICGERDAATIIYEHVPPLSMRPVLRFDKPRFVSPNGNGGLTLRGRCAGDGSSAEEADARWYCVRSPAGATREIRVKGFDLGVERVIGLSDGRVAVLVPPRGGSAGDLSLVGVDGRAEKVALALPDDNRPEALRQLKRGLWLDGFEERSPGVLGGWVESGGPVIGVEIGLDGKVKAGEIAPDLSGAILGGRYGVLLLEGGRAMETSDGGMTYATFDLPDREEEARAAPTRAAGPVGAALPGWVRVGWGDPETPEDMKPAPTPVGQYQPLKVSPTIALSCELATVATPPLPDKPRAATPPPPPPPRRHGMPTRPVARASGSSPWASFRNTLAPALGADEVGVDHGAGDPIGMRAYAWGKKAADWSRTGRWLMRFDDRFDPAGGVRSTAPAASLWSDEATAFEAIGGASYGSAGWTVNLDPGGRALLAQSCHGSTCSLYAAGEGQPITPIRDAASRLAVPARPYAGAAVRVGDTWFFLAQSASYDAVTLWRVDLGAARALTTYYRPIQRYGYETPRLVRRAVGSGVAILVGGQPDTGERSGSWYVIPIDPETGTLGESVVLVRRDFAGAALSRCAPEQDGWVFDVKPETAVLIDVENARASLDQGEMRVRVDPGRACVEGFAARTAAFFAAEPKGASGKAPPRVLTAPPGRKGGDVATNVPLAVNETGTGRRWGLTCRIKPPSLPAPPPAKAPPAAKAPAPAAKAAPAKAAPAKAPPPKAPRP